MADYTRREFGAALAAGAVLPSAAFGQSQASPASGGITRTPAGRPAVRRFFSNPRRRRQSTTTARRPANRWASCCSRSAPSIAFMGCS
jgi:hypothetical protein